MDNYEEKYKKALSWMQGLYKGLHGKTKEEAEEVFPELKESEDEKIRKFLIQMAQNGHGEDRDWWNKCVAWLKKQGEQKPADKVEPKFKVGDEIEAANEESLTITKIDDKGYWSEDLFICSFDDASNWELVAQKPAWSEEDEDRLNSCVDAINAVYKWDGMIAWLKSLKERVQPRQEWSEEDEIARNALINLVEMYYGGCINKSEKNRLLDWLKSLRPQNWTKEDKDRYISCLQRLGTGNPEQPETINSKWFKEHVYPQKQWKPSIAQLNALSIVSKGCAPDDIEEIKSLYADLKKLREE